MLSRQELGNELKEMLLPGHSDIKKIADWAYELYSFSGEKWSRDIYYMLYGLAGMTADECFEYTEEQLNVLADKLLANEKNAYRNMLNQFNLPKWDVLEQLPD